MDIVVKGRKVDVSERFRRTAEEKLTRVDRFDHKLQRIDVELIEERNPRQADQKDRVELTCRSKGPVMRAEASSSDPLSALDLAIEKLEMRMRKAHERRNAGHGKRSGESVASATSDAIPPVEVTPAPAGDDEAGGQLDETAAGLVPPEKLGAIGDGPLVVREKVHKASPITLDEALFEMELVGHDFYLFVDKESGCPSVVYRRRGYDFGVIRLETEG